MGRSESLRSLKESKFMNAKIKYTDEPLGDLKVIPDFLPAPEELAFQDDTVKVTITLSRSSVEFFKREAKKHRLMCRQYALTGYRGTCVG